MSPPPNLTYDCTAQNQDFIVIEVAFEITKFDLFTRYTLYNYYLKVCDRLYED